MRRDKIHRHGEKETDDAETNHRFQALRRRWPFHLALAPPPALAMTCLLLLLTSNALDEASFSCFNKEEEGEEKEETTTSALEEYPALNFDVALFLLSCCLFLKVNLF